MDLFLSAQSVGLAAFVTAGCMVAGGVIAQARALRRASRQRHVAPEATASVASLSHGKHVLVAGVLRVEGSCCPRLEDAMPVAATTFEQPGRSYSDRRPADRRPVDRRRSDVPEDEGPVAWCDRARHLRMQVGDVSIALDGPVRVVLGADELYPACAFQRLRGRVAERILASSKMAAAMLAQPKPANVPPFGVFRSVGHGDQVVVAGIVEPVADADGPASYRQPGGGWRLRPDESGTLRLWSRRRPRVRGGLGAIRAYAAAILF
jgi:hypothetical protein